MMKIDWQRGKIVVTLEANDLEADWKGFLTAVREEIPSRHREYRSDEKAWIINKRYAPLVDELARQYLTVESQYLTVEPQESLISADFHESPVPLVPPSIAVPLSLDSVLPLQSMLIHDTAESAELPVSPSTWPFVLLSLSFAIIGWWTATTAFPSVWRYILSRPRAFPLFDGIIFGLSAVGGLGSTIYALWLLFQKKPETRVENRP